MAEEVLKVDSFNVSKLRNAAYVEYMTIVRDIFNEFPVVVEKLKNMIDSFNAFLIQADKALVAELGSSQTVALGDADKARDNVHRGLCHFVEAHRYNVDPLSAEAAEKLKRIIKKYGTTSLRSSGYDDETALIRSLIADLTNEDNNGYSTQIGLTQWISDLTNANTAFEQVMSARLNEAADGLGYTVSDIRKKLTPVYRLILQSLETMAAIEADASYAEAINKLNAEIAYKK